MADPVDPNSVLNPTAAHDAEVAAKAIEGYKNKVNDARQATESFNQSSGLASTFLQKMGIGTQSLGLGIENATQKLENFVNGLGRIHNVTKAQSVELGLLVNAVDNVGKSFQGQDFAGTNGFSEQLNKVIATIGTSEKGMRDLAKSMGISAPVGMAVDAIKKLIVNTAASADNAVRLRDVYTTLAAKTGDLGTVHDKAGTGFKNMNSLIRTQQESINASIKSTNLSADAVEKYYSQLGTIPGALNANVKSLGGMTGGVNLLTSTIQFARGAGMDYSTVVDSMRKAIVGYGASIPEALTFTARISEVSKKYKIELDDVKQTLFSVSDAFKMFGKDTQSGAVILNQYVGYLKGTGLSGQAASEVVGNMTKQISQLTVAQKAWISAQSGGAGGLQGAFQIDALLREQGGQKKVMDMVMKTMQKEMGPLVSLDDAKQGGPAAGQYQKQLLMLQQGPLGSLAKSQAEAEHLVDALKAMSEGKAPEELKDAQTVMKDTMKEGAQYQQQTATGISRMVSLMEEARGMATGGALSLIQSGATAGAGEKFTENAGVTSGRRTLLKSMEEAAHRDPNAKLSEKMRDRAGQMSAEVIQDWAKFAHDLPVMMRAPISGIKTLLQGGKVEEAHKEYKTMVDDIEKRKLELKNAPAATRGAEIQKLDDQENLIKSTYAQLVATDGKTGAPLPKTLDMSFNLDGDVGAAANRSVNRAVANNASPNAVSGSNSGPGPQAANGEITVHVEGYCIACESKIKNQSHRSSVNKGSDIPK